MAFLGDMRDSIHLESLVIAFKTNQIQNDSRVEPILGASECTDLRSLVEMVMINNGLKSECRRCTGLVERAKETG